MFINALDCNDGWIVVYMTHDGDSWVSSPSNSIWMVPGTVEI